MRTSPRRTTRIDNALPQKKFRQAMSASHQIPASILTGTDQISGCLLFYRRDRDLDDLVQSEQPRQMQRVASIGLDAVTSRSLQFRRRNHHALHTRLIQSSVQAESGRSGLVDGFHRTRQRTQPGEDLTGVRT